MHIILTTKTYAGISEVGCNMIGVIGGARENPGGGGETMSGGLDCGGGGLNGGVNGGGSARQHP